MSWRSSDLPSADFNLHGARNAFRGGNDDDETSLGGNSVASLRAMRSFTESVEIDEIPPPPELPSSLDIDAIGMKTSDTNDTIIEVKPETSPSQIDPSLGETQKYKMTVPGPGHSDAEQELHKSLIKDEGEELDAEVEGALASVPDKSPAGPPSAFSRYNKSQASGDGEDVRQQYNKAAYQRPRPTTPTSSSVIEAGIAFVPEAVADIKEVAIKEQKIKVSIPTGSRRRKSEMSYSEFYDSMAAQMPSQSRGGMSSGRSTPLNDYDGDILEENPVYKNKAPPAPVVHRRTSVEWENFEDAKEQMQRETEAKKAAEKKPKKLDLHAKPPTVEITSPDAPHTGCFHDNPPPAEEEPTFSEDMQEERNKQKKKDKQDKKEGSGGNKTEDKPQAGASSIEKSEAETVRAATGNTDNSQQEETAVAAASAQEATETEGYSYDQQQTEWDPNAYPGYIWNYDKQEWEVDPNYVPPSTDGAEQAAGYDASQYYDYSQYGQDYQGYDQNYQGYYDQSSTGDYSYAQNAYGQDYAGYDQTAATTAYDQSAYNYDYQNQSQTAAGYDQNYSYDYANYNNDQQQYSQEYSDGHQQQSQQTESAQPTSNSYDYNSHQQQTLDYQQDYQPPPATASGYSAPSKDDPYAWENQSHAESQETATKPPPSRPAPPSRPEPPKASAADTSAPPPRPPPARPPPARPAPPPANAKKAEEPEEDAWTKFKKMTEQASTLAQNVKEQLKDLSETSAVKDIKDESYLASIGGEQGYVHENTQREIQRLMEEKRHEKLVKKKMKREGKKGPEKEYNPDEEDDMDRRAQELAMKMAAMRSDIGDWKPPPGTEMPPAKPDRVAEIAREESMSAIPPRKKSSIKDAQQNSGGSLELPAHLAAQQQDSVTPKGDLAPDDPTLSAPAWADFEASDPVLPPSESGFFSNKDQSGEAYDPFIVQPMSLQPAAAADPFAPTEPSLIDENYDPFAVRPVEDIVAAAKAKAEEAADTNEEEYFGAERHSPALSTPTPEGGSPLSQRPNRFEDEFKVDATDLETPTPLYDEDDSVPLDDFMPKFTGEGWELMLRHPIKKKSFMAERYWKPCFVRINGNSLYVYNSKTDNKQIHELLLQATYSLSDTTLQAYDVYGKIHTVKLQYVQYKEKVGIRPGQISRLMEGHITKYGMPLEHSAQCNVLLKFGSLNAAELQSFVHAVEDILFHCSIQRASKPVYKQDEVQIHCYDEYSAYVDKDGVVSDQKARVRMFCLAFVTGSPLLEIGLNDRRRQGKEIVRRKDILPMYTERWIRFENLEFHSIVDKKGFDEEQVIRFSPPDGTFLEIMRFRIRPPRNREKALTVKALMKIAGSKVEIRMEAMAASQIEKNRGGETTRRQIPCEDICIRFPIPEAWIYIFREERHWGVGSVHSKKLRPGKVKNLKDRLLGAVQSNEPNLIEVAIGEAKYEHVYRSLVWRIPRLPEKHHAAYKVHLLKCRFELSSFDLMPETFLPQIEVDFTMPLATVSNTVVRSVSVEQHEDSDRVEKFVRYVAKCQYKVAIDYVQCADLDIDTKDPSVNPERAEAAVPEMHQPEFHPDSIKEVHEGYRIDFNESEFGGPPRPADSSSDEEDDKPHKMPMVQINMTNYGY